MAFHDVRLPAFIEQGAKGGPRFKTTVFTLNSGFEQRNQDWVNTRGEWDISYGFLEMQNVDIDETIHTVRDFFYARRGQAHSFRFKDWADFQVGTLAEPQQIGVGDGGSTDFQAIKIYEPGSYEYQRTLTKLVEGALKVYLDGALQTETTDYTVEYASGLISFLSAPAVDVVVTIVGEYDFPVRFAEDALDMVTSWTDGATGAGEISGIKLIEVRE
jgi:uncharacterized protein (TIGR02217 family)